jgi:hypothetical protein
MIQMHPDDIHKTAISTSHGAFEWTVVPFGITGAPATFNRMMGTIFGPHTDHWATTRAFFDDIGVGTDDWGDHVAALRRVLTTLRDNGLFVNFDKCHFGVSEINHLGHIVTAHGLRIDPDRVNAMKEWPTPTSHAELRTFLGHCTYLSRYIR